MDYGSHNHRYQRWIEACIEFHDSVQDLGMSEGQKERTNMGHTVGARTRGTHPGHALRARTRPLRGAGPPRVMEQGSFSHFVDNAEILADDPSMLQEALTEVQTHIDWVGLRSHVGTPMASASVAHSLRRPDGRAPFLPFLLTLRPHCFCDGHRRRMDHQLVSTFCFTFLTAATPGAAMLDGRIHLHTIVSESGHRLLVVNLSGCWSELKLGLPCAEAVRRANIIKLMSERTSDVVA